MPKVALIEDDAVMLSLLQTLLEYEGYETVQLDGMGKVGDIVAMLRQARPDLTVNGCPPTTGKRFGFAPGIAQGPFIGKRPSIDLLRYGVKLGILYGGCRWVHPETVYA